MRKILLAILLLRLAIIQVTYGIQTEGWENESITSQKVSTQRDLTYQGRPINTGCVPMSIAYLTSLLGHPVSAQYILDANAKQGEFTSQGMSLTSAHDELKQAGFSARNFWNEVPAVPFISVSRTHARVVLLITDVVVTFYDPWDGQLHTWPRFYFDITWECKCGLVIQRRIP